MSKKFVVDAGKIGELLAKLAGSSSEESPELQEFRKYLSECELAEVGTLVLPSNLHEDTKMLVTDFAEDLALKLKKSEDKYGYSNQWMEATWMDECRQSLHEHIAKGDPRDVAAYCAFLWYHREPTV